MDLSINLSEPYIDEKIWGKELQFGEKIAKIIIAKEPLSVQYHPIKEELFIALQPTIVYKLNSAEYVNLKYSMEINDWNLIESSGDILTYMAKFELNPGDELYIESGDIHCIYSGKILELSSCNDITIRLYDFNRKR